MAGLDIQTLQENFSTACRYQQRENDTNHICKLSLFYTYGVSDIECQLQDACPIAEDIQEWRVKNVEPGHLGDHA